MNSSCSVLCGLNWIVFMATVKHFRVKMRLASFCCVKVLNHKYSLPREIVFIVYRKLDFHSPKYVIILKQLFTSGSALTQFSFTVSPLANNC